MSVLALCLLVSIAAGLLRILRGPSRADRLLAIQLFGTTGTALMMILAYWFEQPALLDTALVLALLAAAVSAALVQYLRRARHD